jgi:hypothetical protein
MRFRSALIQLLIIFVTAGSSYAAKLNQQAVAAWDNYIASVKVHMQERLTGKSPFLWVDEDPMRRHRLNSGEIVISPVGNSHPLTHSALHATFCSCVCWNAGQSRRGCRPAEWPPLAL